MALTAPPPDNFASHLFTLNAGRAARPAYIDDHGVLDYGTLERRSRCLAAALLALGLRRDERVLLLAHDASDWPVAFLACLYVGVVPVAVNTLLTADDYAYMLQHSRACAAVVSAALLPVLTQARTMAAAAGGDDIDVTIVIAAPAPAPAPAPASAATATHGLDALIDAHAPLPAPARTSADEPAFWLYSSGSTGRPKAAVHTQGSLYLTAEMYGKAVLGLRADDVCFSAAKLFFAYGLGNALSFPLSVGATVVLMAERPTPAAVFQRWRQHRPTVFFGAPTGFAGLLAAPELPPRGASPLRLCSSAGEALPAELSQRFAAHFGVDIIDGIGSTEMLHIFISNRPGQVRHGSTGWPVPGYTVQLRASDEEGGRPVADGEIGDLYVSGPTAALMYWGQRAKSAETFQGAWVKSGDKYLKNADGSYSCAGRSDDMLKVSGIYVSPVEVEATLLQHPAVLEAAVIGVTDADGLTRSKAFVVRKPGADVDEAALKTFVKERLAAFKYPRHIAFIDELPKTATGKIQRFKLREMEAAVR